MMSPSVLPLFLQVLLLAGCLVDAERSSIPQESLIAYYPFDADARDASGHEHHGLLHGATPTVDRS